MNDPFRPGDRVIRRGDPFQGTVVRVGPTRVRVRWESRHQSHTPQTVQSWILATRLVLATPENLAPALAAWRRKMDEYRIARDVARAALNEGG